MCLCSICILFFIWLNKFVVVRNESNSNNSEYNKVVSDSFSKSFRFHIHHTFLRALTCSQRRSLHLDQSSKTMAKIDDKFCFKRVNSHIASHDYIIRIRCDERHKWNGLKETFTSRKEASFSSQLFLFDFPPPLLLHRIRTPSVSAWLSAEFPKLPIWCIQISQNVMD